ncbi:unnamed protein product [Anisakis simplex]|uniref:LSM14 domain-containing protein n=1 Tax=Anisakis simplex TaxID=6269 RepID=A0A0M3J624_ANISI|nr:unnamed protein product [Anisakis simplex]
MTSSATYCIGSVISVDCTDESCIQGRLAAVDRTTNSITIERAFKNGHPLNEKLLSLPIVNIKNVKILKLNSQSSSSNATSSKTNNEVIFWVSKV